VDLSPRVQPPVPAVRRKRPWPAMIVLALVLVAGGIVVTKFLTSAIDYYCNVDEIGVKSGCEAGRTLRVQGTVERNTVVSDGGITDFRIAFNGRALAVRYDGDPGGLFQECIPVVVHGKLQGDLATGVFHGDQVEVKHSEDYEKANPGRVESAESADCPQGR
jgi:cytochrome c-type biogenesis protein CcmE